MFKNSFIEFINFIKHMRVKSLMYVRIEDLGGNNSTY